jgi:hypothetical protein
MPFLLRVHTVATPSRAFGRTARNQFDLLGANVNQNCNLQFFEFLIGDKKLSVVGCQGAVNRVFVAREEIAVVWASWQAG